MVQFQGGKWILRGFSRFLLKTKKTKKKRKINMLRIHDI